MFSEEVMLVSAVMGDETAIGFIEPGETWSLMGLLMVRERTIRLVTSVKYLSL